MGLIYQFYNLIPVLSVRENITLPVLMDGRDVNEERVEEEIKAQGEPSAKPALRRAAAEGVYRESADERSGAFAGG